MTAQSHPLAGQTPTASGAATAELRGWGLLAAGSLAVAGLLALLLAVSRTPGAQDFLPWPWQTFFPKALVTHVVFSFVVWYVAMLGAMCVLVARAQGRPSSPLSATGLGLSVLGGAILLAVTLANLGEPSLNNYVPVLTHPAYYAGLAILGLGVALPVGRMLADRRSRAEPFAQAVSVAGLSFLSALLCFGLAWAMVPADLDAASFNERVFWGGGHVLQFTNTALMLAAWHLLAVRGLGVAPLPAAPWRAALAGLALFSLAAPAIFLVAEPLSKAYRDGFADLLWYGLAVPPAVVILGLLAALAGRKPRALPWREPAFIALFLSLLLFAVGGVFGFFLGVGDTRTPSHYHAVIGGVNLALMGLLFVTLLPAIGRPPRVGRVLRSQFWLYGVGQLMFSIGMFAAGAAGVPRKTAGTEQGLDSIGKIVSMGLTGLGGVIAVIGGILFIWLALKGLLTKPTAPPAAEASATPAEDGGRLPAVLVGAAMVALLVAMPVWRGGPPPQQGYEIDPAAFAAQVDAMIAAHATGEEVDGVPLVAPPPGDIYLMAQRFSFYPALELRAGQTYRLHVAAMDVLHGFHGPGVDLLLAPGRAEMVEITPRSEGSILFRCSEYCGADHNAMKTVLRVVPEGRK